MELNPTTVVWEYTLACNSKCIHCGSSAAKPRKNELTELEALRLVRDIKETGFKLIVLSGGEATLRKDWYNTAKYITKQGLNLGIISNGLAWTNDTLDKLIHLQPWSIGFSVDGEEQLHDYLRGVQGSHKKIFGHIKTLKKHKQTICAITTVNSMNINELDEIKNRLVMYDVDAWQIQTLTPMGRMDGNKTLILNEDQYYSLAEFIAKAQEDLPLMNIAAGDCIGYFGDLGTRVRGGQWKGCMAGIEGVGIESNGNVKGCLSIMAIPCQEGNIRVQPFKEIWENPANFSYNRNFRKEDLKGECFDCEYGIECRGGCASSSTAFFKEFHHAPYCISRYEEKLKNEKV